MRERERERENVFQCVSDLSDLRKRLQGSSVR